MGQASWPVSALSPPTLLMRLDLCETEASGDVGALSLLMRLTRLGPNCTGVSGNVGALSPLMSLKHPDLYNISGSRAT